MKKKLAILFLTIVCICSFYFIMEGSICAADTAGIIRNDETGIPDKVLYQAVLEKLHKGSGESFTKQEAENIGWLDAKDGVASLKGIGYLSNLKELNLEGNHLETLAGVEELSKLDMLTAEKGRLKSLEGIETLSSLRYLSVIDNELTSLKGIENLTNLEWLIAGENKLTNLDEIKNLTNLVSIWILNCRLEKLPDLTKFPKLEAKYCEFSKNNFTEKELKSKLPQRFFDESDKDYDWEWAYSQLVTQYCNYKITLTAPANNKITGNTKKITGKAYKNSRIILYDPTERIKIKKTITDKKGEFVLSNLDLKKWTGQTLVMKVAILATHQQHYRTVGKIFIKVKKG